MRHPFATVTRLRNSSMLTRVALVGAAAAMPFGAANALPTGAQVESGAISISQPNAQNLVVNQGSDRAIINWQGFDILSGESTRFNQPSANSVALNRIGGGRPSQILGNLSANGKLYLVNPNGVVFGAGSQIDVAGLVASSADIKSADFLAGKMNFTKPGNADASITNAGTITAAQGGLVALVAPNVRNDGVIQAQYGTVQLAGASTVTVDMYGDNLYSFALGNADNGASVSNTGTVKAGTILLTANAAKDIVTNVVNNTGVLEATTAHMDGGTLVLGGENSAVHVAGKLNASGKGAGKKGGSITVTGKTIELASANVDASGSAAGGTVKIGGDYQGGGDLARADTVAVDADSVINVSAENGDAGRAIVWSDDATQFSGTILGTGKNGGFAEVSGKNTLDFSGYADLHATDATGTKGHLLLDPTNITIGAVLAFASELILNTGTDVTLTTSNSGGQAGDITVLSAINWSGTGSLILNAIHDIIVNSSITSTTAGVGGNVTLTAGNNVQVGGNGANGANGLSGTNALGFVNGTTFPNASNNNNGGNGSVSTQSGKITLNAGSDVRLGGDGANGGNGGNGGDGANGRSTAPRFTGGNGGDGANGGNGGNGGTGTLSSVSGDIALNANRDVVIGSTKNGVAGAAGTRGNNATGARPGNGGAAGNGGTAGVSATGSITSGSGNVVITSDADNANAGAIALQSGASITTGAGNITLTGGNGYAKGSASLALSPYADPLNPSSAGQAGILIHNASVKTTSGNIVANGKGGNNGQNVGVQISGTTGKLETTSGDITLDGIGGNTSSYGSYGVVLGDGASATTASGDIKVTGKGGITGAGLGYGNGVQLYNGSSITSTGKGKITLNGTAGGPSSGGNFGIFTLAGSNVIGGANANGKITLNADSMSLSDVKIQGKKDIKFDTNGVILANNATITTTGKVNIDPSDVTLTGSSITGAAVTIDPVTNVTLTNSTITATAGDLTINNSGVFASNTTGNLNATGDISLRQNAGGKIQKAIDAVGNYAHALLTVGAGTFNEQVTINNKSHFTLTGAGAANTTISAPDLLATNFTGSYPIKAVVGVDGGTDVTLSNFTVDGLKKGDANNRFTGVALHNAGGEVSGLTITNIQNNPANGSQAGYGIYSLADAGNFTLNIHDNNVNNFQKNGIFLTSSATGTITANVHDNTITGLGAIDFIAQNGIVFLSGTKGVIDHNTLSGFGYTPLSVQAANILLFQAGDGVEVSNNTITGTGVDAGVNAYLSNGVNIHNNSITGSLDGVVADSSTGALINANTITGALEYGIALYDASNATVSNNTISGAGIGIMLDGSGGTDNATRSSVSGNLIYNANGNAIDVNNSAFTNINSNNIGYAGFDSNGALVAGTAGNIKGDGIRVAGSNNANILGNTITRTASTGFDIGSGIFVSGSDDVTVGGIGKFDVNTISDIAWDGIKFSGGSNATVQNNTLDGVTRAGIYLGGVNTASVLGNTLSNVATNAVGAIESDNGSNLTIRGNDVKSSNANGISMNNAGGVNVIDDNKVGNTASNGIRVDNASGLEVTDNLVRNTGANGISVVNSNGASIKKNIIGFLKRNLLSSPNDNIKGDGIFVDNSDNAVIARNTITETSSTGYPNGSGIQVLNSDGVTIGGDKAKDGNTITNAGWDGIRTQDNSNLTVQNNSIDNIALNGIYSGNNATATFADNSLNNSSFDIWGAISIDGGSNISVLRNDIDNSRANGILIRNATGTNLVDGNSVDFTSVDGVHAANVEGLTVSNNKVGTDGGKITHDGIAILDSASAQINTNTVSYFGNVGVFVDPSPHAVVSGNTISSGLTGIAILDSASVTVKNNIVHDVTGKGITLTSSGGEQGDRSKVNGNVVYNTGSNAIDVAKSAYTTLANNVIGFINKLGDKGLANNINGDGIRVDASNNVVIKGNDVTRTTAPANTFDVGSGIFVINSDDVTIGGEKATDGNSLSDIAWDGIKLSEGDRVTVQNNSVDGTQRVGIYAGGVSGLTVSDNDVANANIALNDYGAISTDNGANITISGNTINKGIKGKTNGHGIRINAATGENTISGNNVRRVMQDGIHVTGSSNVTIGGENANAGNTVKNVDGNGIYGQNLTTFEGGSTLVSNNDVSKTDKDGINLDTVNNARVTNNSISDAGRDGIHAVNLTVLSSMWDSVLDGDAFVIAGPIFVGSNQSIISGNSISDVKRDGIHIENVANTYVVDNTINDTGRDGIFGSNLYVTNSFRPVDFIVAAPDEGDGVPLNLLSESLLVDEPKIGFNQTIIANNRINEATVKPQPDELVKGNDYQRPLAVISTSGRDGIHLEGSQNTLITENTIRNVDSDGINVRDLTVTQTPIFGEIVILDGNGNQIESGFGIIETVLGESEISFNDIRNAGRDGIHVRPARKAVDEPTSTDEPANSDGIELTLGDSEISDGPVLLEVMPVDETMTDGMKLTGKLTIKRNTINNVDRDGVNIDGITDFAVRRNDITASRDGVNIKDASDFRIRKNDIYASRDGVHVRDANDFKIINNDIDIGVAVVEAPKGRDGINIANSNDFSVTDNDIAADRDGVNVRNANDFSIDENDITRAGRDGVHIRDAGVFEKVATFVKALAKVKPNFTVTDNTITATRDGIWIKDSNNFEVTGNKVNKAGRDGISLIGATGTNLVDDNTVHDTTGRGIVARTSTGLTVSNNVVYNAGANGIDISGSTSVMVNGNYVGFTNKTGTPGDVNNINGDGIRIDASNGATIKGNKVTRTTAPANSFDVGSGIFVSGSDDVTIGSTTAADGNSVSDIAWDGIKLSGGSRITVQNNTVDGVQRAGIYLGGVSTASVLNNTLSKVATDAVGAIESDNGSDLTISKNMVNSSNKNGISVTNAGGTNLIDDNIIHNTTNAGIITRGTGGLTVSNNVVYNTGANGIDIAGSPSVMVNGNYVGFTNKTGTAGDVGNIKGDGILVNASDNAVISNNFASQATGAGVRVSGSNGASATGNTLTFNGTGLVVQQSSGFTGTRNTATNNVTGAALNFSNNATLTSNNFSNNTDTGLLVLGGSGLNAGTNTINDNDTGISLSATSGSTLTGNIVERNTTGLDSQGDSLLAVNGNFFRDGGTGALLSGSNAAVLRNNLFSNNLIGVDLNGSSNVLLSDETFTTNAANGIGLELFNGSANTLVENTSFSGGDIAILIDGAVFSRIPLEAQVLQDGQEVALQLQPEIIPGSSLQFLGEDSSFSNVGFYFVLQNGAMVGQTLDASGQTFDGTRARDFTPLQLIAAENKTIDVGDDLTLGDVFYADFIDTNQNALNDFQRNRRGLIRQGLFSYAGRTLSANVEAKPVSLNVNTIDLSLLSNSAPITTPTQVANFFATLAPAAGGPVDAKALANLSPASGGPEGQKVVSNTVGGSCGNSFLGTGFAQGFSCGAQ
ncbi:MAG: right-handed parallel beta-helix repeat-containing protein [Rickettsiales bacterium]